MCNVHELLLVIHEILLLGILIHMHELLSYNHFQGIKDNGEKSTIMDTTCHVLVSSNHNFT